MADSRSAGQGACDSCGTTVVADRTGCQRWWLGASGQSCSTVCAAAGHACADGDWGVGDRASLEAALAEAGQSSSDRASLCSDGYRGIATWLSPCVVQSSCYWKAGGETRCSEHSAVRRLCRCA